jgi:hypothetical protein
VAPSNLGKRNLWEAVGAEPPEPSAVTPLPLGPEVDEPSPTTSDWTLFTATWRRA